MLLSVISDSHQGKQKQNHSDARFEIFNININLFIYIHLHQKIMQQGYNFKVMRTCNVPEQGQNQPNASNIGLIPARFWNMMMFR